MNATIITTKEEVDYQFQYPGRNKVIKEYKYIKDSYSWGDEFESESEITKYTNSPKIYDLRTPQKKSSKMKMYSDSITGSFSTLTKIHKAVELVILYKANLLLLQNLFRNPLLNKLC